jgi:hypothetical protein
MAGTTPTPFYVDVLKRLIRADIPFVVGGGFAFSLYSGVDRVKKDLDIFVREADARRALEELGEAGYNTDLTFPHWLGKIRCGAHLIDLIFSSGNGIARVDDLWFQHSVPAMVLGANAQLCPPEEMIWSKAFIQERERFDGADVLHLVRSLGATLDWQRLIWRFGEHWRVLLASLVLFGYVYPSETACVPTWVSDCLSSRLSADRPDPMTSQCRGTLLSRAQYRWDIEQLGYTDARIQPAGAMTRDEIAVWDAGIEEIEQP